MGYKELFLFACFVTAASTQTYRVCVSQGTPSNTCQSISKDDSQVQCLPVESRVDCALKLTAGEADFGVFSEEETLLLGQQQPTQHAVLATIRDAAKLDPYAFEAVAVVPSTHTNGLEGLRGGVYCHPGLGHAEVRWSPRVLKSLEELAARTDRCPETETAGKTADELEVETLNNFFSAACRPGIWSANATVDANLKSAYPNLCSLCGQNANCSSYTIDMGINIAGVSNNNRHIQALECLRVNSNSAGRSAVAYVAWQHVREYFNTRNPQDAASFGVLCTNGTVVPLAASLGNETSPCAIVRQPWRTIVANTNRANALLESIKTWWPVGADPGGNTWQSILFGAVVGGSSARINFQATFTSPLNYTQSIRNITGIDSTASCLPARRWCVISSNELMKCNWVRASSYILGLQPPIACQLRSSTIECLADIKANRADFISTGTNYGYLARKHYQLGPVKLVQNTQAAAARVAAFVKETAAASQNLTRFENLKGRKACFPEFGGLAYMAFVRAGVERKVLPSDCDYARVVGEFFEGACAPGAIDAAHALTDSSSFDSSVLCSTCRSTITIVGPNGGNGTCAWDYSNLYFGNNGSLACLADPDNDVAFLNMRSISTHLASLGLQANQFRALCRNNSLAVNPGININDGCLLAYVVDAEVLTRRGDALYNALNVLLDSLDVYFGYGADIAGQLINLEIFSPFNGISDLLFKDTTIDLTEPSLTSSHEPAKNYMQLFEHLDQCTSAATGPTGPTGFGIRNVHSIVTLVIMALLSKFVFV